MRLGFHFLISFLVIFVYPDESFARRSRCINCVQRCPNGVCQIPQSVGCRDGRCQVQQPFFNEVSLDPVRLQFQQQGLSGFNSGVNFGAPSFGGVGSFDANGFAGNIGVGSSGGFFPGQGFGVGASGFQDPTQLAQLGGGQFPSLTPVGGVQGFGGDQGFILHNRSTGPARKVGNRWIENVNVADPTIRVSTGQQIVVDPGTGQPIASFPGMLVIDTGQVVNGRRVVFPASRESVATVLGAYATNPNMGSFAQFILSNYQTNLPQFTSQVLQGFGSGIPGGNPFAQINQGGQGGGNPGGAPPPPNNPGTPDPNQPNNPAVGPHGSDPSVQPSTPPPSQEPAAETRWSKWKNRYDAAGAEVEKDKLFEYMDGVTIPVEGKPYKARVIRQVCASKGKPDEIKPMTLILYTSQVDGTPKNHVVVHSGALEETVEAEYKAIIDGWAVAKDTSEGSPLGDLGYKDASLALVNARKLSEENKAKFPGYEEVQVRVRPVVKDGKMSLFTKQVIKHGDDVKTKESRWADSSTNDKNLFCITGTVPKTENSGSPAETDARREDPKPDTSATPTPPAELRSTATKYCFSCHMSGGQDPHGVFTAEGDIANPTPERLKKVYEYLFVDKTMPPAGSTLADGSSKFESFHSADNKPQVEAIKAWLEANMEK